MRQKLHDALDTALRQQQSGRTVQATPEIADLLSVGSRLEQLAAPAPDPAFVTRLDTLLEQQAMIAPATSLAGKGSRWRSWHWFRPRFAAAALAVLVVIGLFFNYSRPVRSPHPVEVQAHIRRAETLLLETTHPEISGIEREQLLVAYREAVMVVRNDLDPVVEEAWLATQLDSLEALRDGMDATTYQELNRILVPAEAQDSTPTSEITPSVVLPATSEPEPAAVMTTTLSTTLSVATPTRPRNATTPIRRATTVPTSKQEPATPTNLPSPTTAPPTPTLPPPPTSTPPRPTASVRPTTRPEQPRRPAPPTARPTDVPTQQPAPTQTQAAPTEVTPEVQPTSPAPEHPTQAAGPPEEHPTSHAPDEPPGQGPPEERPTSHAPDDPPGQGPPEERPTSHAPDDPPGQGPPEEHPTPRAPEHPTPVPEPRGGPPTKEPDPPKQPDPPKEQPTKKPDEPQEEKPTKEPQPTKKPDEPKEEKPTEEPNEEKPTKEPKEENPTKEPQPTKEEKPTKEPKP